MLENIIKLFTIIGVAAFLSAFDYMCWSLYITNSDNVFLLLFLAYTFLFISCILFMAKTFFEKDED